MATAVLNLKTLAQRFQAAINQHDLDAALALVDDQLIDHAQAPGTPPGKQGMRRFYEAFFSAFSDFRITPEDVSAEGDMVVLHGLYEGTHTGSFMGIPPTGNPIKSYVVEVFRTRGDKFVERYHWFDIMIIMRSLQTPGGMEPIMGTRAGSFPSTTTPEQKKAKIRQYFDEMVIPRNLDHMIDFLGDGVLDHSAAPGMPAGVEGAKMFLNMSYAAFPWTDYHIQHIIVDGDLATTVFVIEGEHSGAPFLGTPASGKRFDVQCIEIQRVPADRFIEHWGGMDFLQLSAQLGLGLFGETTGPSARDEALEEAKRLAEQYIDGMNRGDIDMTMDVFADSFVDHQVVPGGASLGNTKADVRQAHEMLKMAFPDVQFALEDLLVEGNSVVMRVSGEGTQQGPFFGIPATGKHIKWTGVRLLRYEDGKFAEGTSELDQVGILQQMGIIPSAPMNNHFDPEGNKVVVRRLIDDLNAGDSGAYDAAMAPDVVIHLESDPTPHKGTRWLKMDDADLYGAFHDLTRQIESITASGDRLATRLRFSGTHSGAYMGVPGTGNPYAWSGVIVDRFEDGKIVERWMNIDRFTLLMQVGIIPSFG
jgi:steroid delta-isomerase-like uncharacterized protein